MKILFILRRQMNSCKRRKRKGRFCTEFGNSFKLLPQKRSKERVGILHFFENVLRAPLEPAHLNLELPQRYRPSTIRGLSEATGFSFMEIKKLYWSFKSECPSGLVNQDEFHLIFSKFFPTGGEKDKNLTDYTQWWPVLTSSANLSSYSQHIFSAMDNEKTGVINFEVETFFKNLPFLLKNWQIILLWIGLCTRVINPSFGDSGG